MTRYIALLVLVGLAPACGDDPDTQDTLIVPVGDDDDETADTAQTAGVPVAAEARLYSFFGWDPATGEVTRPTDYRSEFIIQVTIADYSDANDPAQACFIRIGLEGYTADPEAVANGWLWGLTIPQGDNPAYEEDCTEREFDFSVWEMPNVEEWVAGPHYISIGGNPTDDTEDWLTSVAGVEEAELEDYIGAELAMLMEDEGRDDTYATSTEVDDEGIPIDDGDLIDRYSIATDDGELEFGYYNIFQTVFWFWDG